MPVPDVDLRVLRAAADELLAGAAEAALDDEAPLAVADVALERGARAQAPEPDQRARLAGGHLLRDVHNTSSRSTEQHTEVTGSPSGSGASSRFAAASITLMVQSAPTTSNVDPSAATARSCT
eukprot:CAMPEP_0198593306 /NCGR_PEP_ID=MMETSP1462-20131121/139224_1 /TAXON_ID=1333877 /ORGANISM="Brandtodinium nutriculum, Strain RCC3387" /LENGTH=122 /DNA_ID=CAMNT_0044324905 /DNA_START=87 /DNA_END=452 /DNA_ORIENTATION=-